MNGKRRKKRAAGLTLSLCMLLAAALGSVSCGSAQTQTGESSVVQETENAADAMAEQQTEQAAMQETSSEMESGTQTGPAETADAEDAAEGTLITDATGSLEGIVVEAAMNSLVIDTQEGILYSFSYPESGVEMELEEGLFLGMSVLVTSEDGVASVVQDGPTQPAADRDALTFAADILFACRAESMDSLANLAAFPLYVRLDDGDMTVEDAEEFLSLPQDQVLSEERVEAVLSTNLYEVTELDGGRYVLGSDEGMPNIIFQRDDGRDSGFAIAGIN